MHDPADADDPALDSYEVLVDGPEVEVRVKASRFFGQALSAADPGAAARRVDAIRKRYHDATHHCWAACSGPPGAVQEAWDDDGEPNGTAGLPILHPLRASGRHDAVVVVTRWFGGTKLGKGGLVQAYGECAQLALAAAGTETVWLEREVVVEVDYEDLGTVEGVLAQQAAVIRHVERCFDARPRLVIRVRRSAGHRLGSQLVEATAARADVYVTAD